MISFFRHIRQKLLSQNRVTRYLVYAFGEILLVVIGVLIALQVNNWNQDRLERRKSKEYHERSKSELDQIIDFLAQIEDYSSLVAIKLDQSVAILESGTFNDSTKQIMDYALAKYFQLSRHLPELSNYQKMNRSGQFGLIYNNELRKELSEYLTHNRLVGTIYEVLNEKFNKVAFLNAYVKFEPYAIP